MIGINNSVLKTDAAGSSKKKLMSVFLFVWFYRRSRWLAQQKGVPMLHVQCPSNKMEYAVLHVHNVFTEPHFDEENIFKTRLYCQKRIPLLVKQQTWECEWVVTLKLSVSVC